MSELRCSYFIPTRPIEYPVLPPYFITIKFGLILIMLCTLIIFYDCEFDLIFFHTPVEDIHILWGSMLIIAVIQLLSSGPPNPHVYRRLNSSSFQTFNTCNKCSTTYRLSVSEWIRWKAVSLSILCYSMQTCPSHSVSVSSCHAASQKVQHVKCLRLQGLMISSEHDCLYEVDFISTPQLWSTLAVIVNK